MAQQEGQVMEITLGLVIAELSIAHFDADTSLTDIAIETSKHDERTVLNSLPNQRSAGLTP